MSAEAFRALPFKLWQHPVPNPLTLQIGREEQGLGPEIEPESGTGFNLPLVPWIWLDLETTYSSTISGVAAEHVPISVSPFDVLERTKDREAQLSSLLAFVATALNAPFADRLARRIRLLLDAAKEEEQFTEKPSLDSLRYLLYFFQTNQGLQYPDLVLSPSGYFRAEWHASPTRHFAAEFLPGGDTRFVVFAPNPLHSRKTLRLSGTVSVDLLSEAVRPFGVFEWASE